jgi:hypothetical protein
MKKTTLVSLSLALSLFTFLPLAHSAAKSGDPVAMMSCHQKYIMDAGLQYTFYDNGTFDLISTSGWGPSTDVDKGVAFGVFPGTASDQDGNNVEKVGIIMNETGSYFLAAFTEKAEKDKTNPDQMNFDLYVAQAPYLAPGSTVLQGVEFSCTATVANFAMMFPF